MTSWQEQFDVTMGGLRKIYQEAVEPLENRFQYELFRPSNFVDTLKPAKPFVLFLGPFSAGKSTFINYLLGNEVLWTGPQPTTDKFTIIMHGREVNTISGRILASNPDLPFRGLAEFGDSFLEALSGMQVPSDLLRSVSLIDTPGVLEAAGGQSGHSRNYDYVRVVKWFVERADMVFFLFDPSKLDAGTELQLLIRQLRGYESKVRMVLNKADTVGGQELMRVYGALFWNMSNMIHTTEPPRVYVSSFWNRPYHHPANAPLFDEEKGDLLYELMEVIPLQALDKRVSSLLRRALDLQIFVHILGTMKEKLPTFGKQKAAKEMCRKMEPIYMEVATKYKLTAADFPKPEEFAAFLDRPIVDIEKFPKLTDFDKEVKKGAENVLRRLERAIRVEIPALLTPISQAAAVDPRRARKERGFDAVVAKTFYQTPTGVQPAGPAPLPAAAIPSAPVQHPVLQPSPQTPQFQQPQVPQQTYSAPPQMPIPQPVPQQIAQPQMQPALPQMVVQPQAQPVPQPPQQAQPPQQQPQPQQQMQQQMPFAMGMMPQMSMMNQMMQPQGAAGGQPGTLGYNNPQQFQQQLMMQQMMLNMMQQQQQQQAGGSAQPNPMLNMMMMSGMMPGMGMGMTVPAGMAGAGMPTQPQQPPPQTGVQLPPFAMESQTAQATTANWSPSTTPPESSPLKEA
eukprot:TRINITY_DN80120_c0_g1_i1.p1 TRINITY_DN80120_c0_g1~~TRINITY_DN80120_c0_g1_i1.p1  ORF type:complete len:679 (-),score=142.03 TRINITY_DN80120_c0_g1_i1:6-2042(-)